VLASSAAPLARGRGLPVPLLAYGFVFSLAAVQVSALLLLQKVLEPFELVNVERLQADQLLSHDQSHLLSCVYASMPEKHPHKQGEASTAPSELCSRPNDTDVISNTG